MKELRSEELKKFLEILMDDAPEGYQPWLFPVRNNGKAPDVPRGTSWKDEENQLSMISSMKRLENNNGNIGIAGRPNDRLILVDIDDIRIKDELKPTLIVRSRSGTGEHGIYWADPEDENLPCNIPTDKGEIRSSDQYVVAPGSYVECTEEELEEKVEADEITEERKEELAADPDLGYYIVKKERDIAAITFEELPKIFQQQYKSKNEWEKEDYSLNTVDSEDGSALFNLDITDLTGRGFRNRDSHPLHPSSTGTNWLVSDGLAHCWRHLVSLNALQFLCVESGYLSCLEAGSPHHNSSSGPSEVKGNDEAIWEAWKHAKEQGYIPEDDPMPVRALHHIARRHDLCDEEKIPDRDDEEMLPKPVYRKVLEIVEEEY